MRKFKAPSPTVSGKRHQLFSGTTTSKSLTKKPGSMLATEKGTLFGKRNGVLTSTPFIIAQCGTKRRHETKRKGRSLKRSWRKRGWKNWSSCNWRSKQHWKQQQRQNQTKRAGKRVEKAKRLNPRHQPRKLLLPKEARKQPKRQWKRRKQSWRRRSPTSTLKSRTRFTSPTGSILLTTSTTPTLLGLCSTTNEKHTTRSWHRKKRKRDGQRRRKRRWLKKKKLKLVGAKRQVGERPRVQPSQARASKLQ
mmetsp:Transcript_23274/g.32900  ORF Transcript_23274/g.32900 Transcript_23274/m.32900 type:complete len:249 (+) Transcript_23274:134-880(+)